MIEEARNTPAADAEAPEAEFASSQAMENAALAGAAAIQRLVAECNGLRTRLALQDNELARVRGANESLRRRFGVLHQRYVELAKKILVQLEQFDGAIREAAQEGNGATLTGGGNVANDANGRAEDPMVLAQQVAESTRPAAPKPNGREVPNILQQPPRAPSR
jgi:hypothetical protein